MTWCFELRFSALIKEIPCHISSLIIDHWPGLGCSACLPLVLGHVAMPSDWECTTARSLLLIHEDHSNIGPSCGVLLSIDILDEYLKISRDSLVESIRKVPHSVFKWDSVLSTRCISVQITKISAQSSSFDNVLQFSCWAFQCYQDPLNSTNTRIALSQYIAKSSKGLCSIISQIAWPWTGIKHRLA